MKEWTLIIMICMVLTGCVSIVEIERENQQKALQSPASQGDLPALDTDSDLQDYLAYAALNNQELEAAFKRWKASLEKIPQAKSLSDPRFNYTYFIENVETRVGPQQQKFGVAQMFPWFGKLRLQGDAAAAVAAAAWQVYEQTKLALFYRVKEAYYEYWYLAQAVALTKEHIRLVANMESIARTRFKTGATPNSAVIQAQVELGKLDDRLRTLESQRTPLGARLNAAMNRSTHIPLPWPGSLQKLTASFTDEQAMQWLAENSPELRRLNHVVEKEDIGIKLARKNYYPDITLGVDYVDTSEALNPDMVDSGKNPVMAMVSLNIPIHYGKYRSAEREARLRKAAAVADYANTGKRLNADLALTLYKLRDAERKIDLYKDTLIPKAKQSLSVAQQEYQTGTTSFISLIDAERLLLEFQLAYKRAQANRGQRLAEVEMMTGKVVGKTINGKYIDW